MVIFDGTGLLFDNHVCYLIFLQLLQANKTRENAIKHCIHEMSNNIRSIKEKRETDPDNYELMKKLSSEQTKVSKNEIVELSCLSIQQTVLF